GQRYAFELTPVDLGIDERGRPVTACVVDHIDEAPPKANARVTGKHQIALLAGIREWARSHPGAPLSSIELKEIARVQNVSAKRRPEVVFSLHTTSVFTPTVGGFKIPFD